MYLGTSSELKISSSSKSRLKTKEGESLDCNQEQEKRLRRKDYSRMVRFFGGALFSSTG
jgi:geranylgeranyl pyrophosphate synthase